MAENFLKTYEILYKKAVVDINIAQLALESFENNVVELDLESLYNLALKNNIAVIENVKTLLPLSDYAVEGRYAVIHDDLDSADEYMAILHQFVSYVKEAIQ